MSTLDFSPPPEESAEYRRFVSQRNLNHQPERSPVFAILNRLDELDRVTERAEESKRNAPSQLDVRRAEARIDRLEREQARLYAELDQYPEAHVAAISEASLNASTNPKGVTTYG